MPHAIGHIHSRGLGGLLDLLKRLRDKKQLRGLRSARRLALPVVPQLRIPDEATLLALVPRLHERHDLRCVGLEFRAVREAQGIVERGYGKLGISSNNKCIQTCMWILASFVLATWLFATVVFAVQSFHALFCVVTNCPD